MSITECTQCHAKTREQKRCKRRTCLYSDFCAQHTLSLVGMKIQRSNIPGASKGLFAYCNPRLDSEDIKRRLEEQENRVQKLLKEHPGTQRSELFPRRGETLHAYKIRTTAKFGASIHYANRSPRLLLFKPNEKICDYRGKTISLQAYMENNTGYGIQFGQLVLDAASTQSGLGRWANDCVSITQKNGTKVRRAQKDKTLCQNNVDLVVTKSRDKNLQGHLRANKHIFLGDELFANYGPGYWR